MGKDLNSILASAKFLMSEEGQKRIDHAVKNSSFDDNGEYISNIPSSYQGAGKLMQEAKAVTFDESKAEKLGLPKSVIAAMNEDYAEGGALFNMGNSLTENISSGSILDNFTPVTPTSKPQINEVRNEQYRYNSQPIPQGTNGVDYTIIKAIVDECIKRNIDEIKESILSESSLKTVKLTGGNKIQLLDNKGNLYESTLTFKKNINKK